MKTLVIGATGFIGSAITRHLVDEGGEVRIAVRPNSDTRGLDDLDVERVGADLRDIDSLRAALRGCDRLFLTAALFSHWARDVDAFYEVNVTGTRHALQAALEADVSKIVYTSTNNAIGAYGPNPVDEEVVFNYWDTGDHYSISKYLGEVEATRFAARGLAVVIVNPTLVVGPGDRRPTSSGQLVLEVAGGKLPVYTQGWVNVVDVDDVAAGHLLAAERGRVGERYLLGGTNLTVKEYFGLIAEAAGRRPPRVRLPYRTAVALAHGFEAVSRFTKRHPTATVSEVKIGRLGEWYNSDKAQRELDFTARPAAEAIQRSVTWFKDEGYL